MCPFRFIWSRIPNFRREKYGRWRRGYTHRSGNSIYVWIEEEHLAASWDRFLSALAVTNYFDASRDIPPTPPYSRPENTRTFLTVRISLSPSWRIACDLFLQSRLIIISSFRCLWKTSNALAMKTYRNVHLICRVFDRSLVKCKICIIVKGRNKDRIYQRYYLFLTQLHAVKATKEKLQSNRYMFPQYSSS